MDPVVVRSGSAWLGCAMLAGSIAAVGNVTAQETGAVRGTVRLDANNDTVAGAIVLAIGPGRVALTDDNGRFEIEGLPAGTHELLAQREHLTAARQSVVVEPGEIAVAHFVLKLSPVHEELTVTATTGAETTVFEAFNTITILDAFDLATNPQGTIGGLLEHQPGIAKRSFGPGTSRPIIRGFDGDRVLIMQDGIRTGDLSAQSGDHGVSIDPASLDRLEVVRGPATLLYGSNALGGVVNAITPHESVRATPTDGLIGQATTDGGSTNSQTGGNASLQFGQAQWQLWAGGGRRQTDDYDTPEGPVLNSGTRLTNGRTGFGFAGERLFFRAGYQIEDGRYGVPFAGTFGDKAGAPGLVDVDHLRQSLRVDVGARSLNTPLLESFRVATSVLDWHHEEVETEDGLDVVGTTFDNESVVVRAEFDQRVTTYLSGKFGVWSLFRDYRSRGREALTPTTTQKAFAVFAYEELDFGRYRVQFAGRLEVNDYDVEPRAPDAGAGDEALVASSVRDRDFLGSSGSVGVQADLGTAGAFIANVTRSYRAPALEELYNFGPHVGNLTFEIGDPDLEREVSLGLDLSVRHQSSRVRGELSFYVYDIDGFVFPALTGDVAEGLRVATFLRGDSRFVGFEAEGSVQLLDTTWLNAGLGFVDARLSTRDEALPRIPPLQGQVSVDIPYRGFTVNPEWIWTAEQSRVFRGEPSTAGYSIFNIAGSYVWPRANAAHIFTVRGYNLTNELYRNHTSFIKDLAPEIGQGVNVTYSLRFF